MLGPRYLPSAIQLLNHEHDLYMHHKKLDTIVKEDRKKRSFVDKEGLAKTKLYEVRERNIKFHNTEKNIAIEKDNELLLGRLVEISRKKKSVLFGTKSETTLPRTLNGPSRRREKDRIALENEAFARRLLSQQPCFNRKKLETDYEKHNNRVKNMQRLLNASPKRIKLPPLKSTDFETRNSTSGNGSREPEKKKKSKKNNHIVETEEEHADEQERRANQVQGGKTSPDQSPQPQRGAEENTVKQDTNQPESSASHAPDSAKVQQEEQASPSTGANNQNTDDKAPETGNSQPDNKTDSPAVGGNETEVKTNVENQPIEKTQE